MAQPLILVTNDDGILAEGIAALASALEVVGEVWVYAPDRQQSAVSHCVNLHRPLRVTEFKPQWYMIDGTPTDCEMLAVRDKLGRRPDLVVSGINNGANLGDDITYSGTVAGAYEAMLQGLTAFAISDVSYPPRHLESAARYAVILARKLLETGLPENTMLNVNVPDLPYDQIEGVAVTRMGRREYPDDIIQRTDPRGGHYYWIGGAEPGHVMDEGTDFQAIEQNKVSITPIQRDQTNYEAIQNLSANDFLP